ncbi:hypothetical protein Hamer_G017970 [Homarus americanus]|uniref:Uncharacterized protein n=1 Tax=Homarus americanus TaxID=6706 RepID=A0A8J5TB65_HOMAM|nr:hypothetical protein Hamer_G017970 [Homarus americanus]
MEINIDTGLTPRPLTTPPTPTHAHLHPSKLTFAIHAHPLPSTPILTAHVIHCVKDDPEYSKRTLPYSGAGSYPITGQNPTLFSGGISPSLGTESYHLLAQNPTVFWSDILQSSWAESKRILGRSPTLVWDGLLPNSEAESYRLLGQNPTAFGA